MKDYITQIQDHQKQIRKILEKCSEGTITTKDKADYYHHQLQINDVEEKMAHQRRLRNEHLYAKFYQKRVSQNLRNP